MGSHMQSYILYDFLYCMGGAEKTTLIMQEAFPGSGICTDFINEASFEELDLKEVITLGQPSTCQPLNAIRGIRHFKRKTDFLRDSDLVIYSGSYAPCAVHNQLRGRKVLYCHTLPRFAYDLRGYYRDSLNPLLRPVFDALVSYTRRNYEQAFFKMDTVVCNSENVRARINKYLGAEATVINPPVDTSAFNWAGQGDYYLSTARLEKYKRVDLIVSAFMQMPDKKLVVASGGAELENLKNMARSASNITFTGWTKYDELLRLMGNAIATIYIPKDEDFGMSPVESMAAGKPVIGAMEGGILETVLHGETGLLISPQVSHIVSAVERLTPSAAASMRRKCEEKAEMFSCDNFTLKLREEVS